MGLNPFAGGRYPPVDAVRGGGMVDMPCTLVNDGVGDGDFEGALEMAL